MGGWVGGSGGRGWEGGGCQTRLAQILAARASLSADAEEILGYEAVALLPVAKLDLPYL